MQWHSPSPDGTSSESTRVEGAGGMPWPGGFESKQGDKCASAESGLLWWQDRCEWERAGGRGLYRIPHKATQTQSRRKGCHYCQRPLGDWVHLRAPVGSCFIPFSFYGVTFMGSCVRWGYQIRNETAVGGRGQRTWGRECGGPGRTFQVGYALLTLDYSCTLRS